MKKKAGRACEQKVKPAECTAGFTSFMLNITTSNDVRFNDPGSLSVTWILR
jgi:hypothetical protein